MGFSDEDGAELSDGLVDELVSWGDETAIATRVQEHLHAGAVEFAMTTSASDIIASPIPPAV